MISNCRQIGKIWAKFSIYEALTNTPEYAILTGFILYACKLDITGISLDALLLIYIFVDISITIGS
jgi:hypothetical protein